MKKILFIVHSMHSGGAERQIINVAHILRNKGYDTQLLCLTSKGVLSDLVNYYHIPIVYFQYSSFHGKFNKIIGNIKKIIKIRSFIINNNFESVISFLGVSINSENQLNCFSSIFNLNKWKVIVGTRYNIDLKTRNKLFSYMELHSSAIVCNSFATSNVWKEQYPKYADKIHTIYNVVIPPLINKPYTPFVGNRIHIVIAANYHMGKNPLCLIRSLLMLSKEEREKIEVNYYGRFDDVYYHQSLKLILQNNIECIHLYDSTDNIMNLMYVSDVVGLISKEEGLPNAICEGMMLGKPILMTRVSDYNTLVEEGYNGFICDWDNEQSILNAITRLIHTSFNNLLEMGHHSKLKAESLFSEEHIANQWIDLIEC